MKELVEEYHDNRALSKPWLLVYGVACTEEGPDRKCDQHFNRAGEEIISAS